MEETLGLMISQEQYAVIAPTASDMTVGRILRDVAGQKGSLKMAARKLNNFGEINNQCCHLNSDERIQRIRSTLELAKSLEILKATKNDIASIKAQDIVKVMDLTSLVNVLSLS